VKSVLTKACLVASCFFVSTATAHAVSYEGNLAFGLHGYEAGESILSEHEYFRVDGNVIANYDSSRNQFAITGDFTTSLFQGQYLEREGGGHTWQVNETVQTGAETTFAVVFNNVTLFENEDGTSAIGALPDSGATSYTSLLIEDYDGEGNTFELNGTDIPREMNFGTDNADTSYRSVFNNFDSSSFLFAGLDTENAFGLGDNFFKLWLSASGSNSFINGLGTNFSRLSGDIHASNLSEVPEPMTAALLGIGLLGGAIRRKKQEA